MIDQPTIDRILDAANILDVVSDFVTLRRRGTNHWGLCPFHEDKTPSFAVSPAKNICKCFSCGEGGTAVHFIMKHEQIGYYDALRYLARKYNIEIQERPLTEEERLQRSDREGMQIVNEWAQDYFAAQLNDTDEGRTVGLAYFQERGIRPETIAKFRLGYSPNNRDALFRAATTRGYRPEYLSRLGLTSTHDDGAVTDRFRGRIIFPIHTISGKVAAFGARTLRSDVKVAKYLNSPESELYHKSNELYGIHQARQAITRADRCFLVEGYTDVLSMHQAGIENVVASSGTALTQGQIRLIQRFSQNITLLYDGDAPGIHAALRGIDLLLTAGMNVQVLLLPEGHDPDSFARTRNATDFKAYIESHSTDFVRFKTNLLLRDANNDTTARAAAITDILRSIAAIADPITRTLYLRDTAQLADIPEAILLQQLNRLRQESHTTPHNVSPAADVKTESQPTPQEAAPAADSNYELYEQPLIRYLLRHGQTILFNYTDEDTQQEISLTVTQYIRQELELDAITFQTPLYHIIYTEAITLPEDTVPSRHFLAHPNQAVSRAAANLLTDPHQLSRMHFRYRPQEAEDTRLVTYVPQAILALKDAHVDADIANAQSLLRQAQQAGDAEAGDTHLQHLNRLTQLKRQLALQLGERIIVRM